jgi:DNA-binding transcriptional LysR family regulator
MSLLLAFEASARLGSFTRAAEEIALTQSAVSRQVQTLEELLGIALFVRVRRHIALTEAGTRYWEEVSASLDRIRRATSRAVSLNERHRTLRLSAMPTFGSKRILPHLHSFYAAHPDLMVNIDSRFDNEHTDFLKDDIDATIITGTGQWPGLVAHPLVPVSLVVIASPALLARIPLRRQEDLQSHLLLRVSVRPDDWAQWFAAHGLQASRMRLGPAFELTSHVIQSVVSGVGIGLLPKALVEEELSTGELVSPLSPMSTDRSYYLCYPPASESLPPLVAFREWLSELFGTGGRSAVV